MIIKTLNTNELVPDYFYIFPNRYSNKLSNQIEIHNIGLREGTLVSSGFSNVLCSDQQREKFLHGELDYLPFVIGEPTTIGTINPFLSRITERYTLEYNLEVYRSFNYKVFPSRFSGIFAFGDYESCKSIARKKNWDIDSVKRYKLRDLGSLNDYIKVIKANFNIIGALEHYGTTTLTNQTLEAIRDYWMGAGSITIPELKMDNDIILPEQKCGVRWEYLIEGVLDEA